MVFDDQSNNCNIDVILDVENYVLNKESKKIYKEIRFIYFALFGKIISSRL